MAQMKACGLASPRTVHKLSTSTVTATNSMLADVVGS